MFMTTTKLQHMRYSRARGGVAAEYVPGSLCTLAQLGVLEHSVPRLGRLRGQEMYKDWVFSVFMS